MANLKANLKIELTEDDLFFLNEALHAHKRVEMEYLMSIKDTLTNEDYRNYKHAINNRHKNMIKKLFGAAN